MLHWKECCYEVTHRWHQLAETIKGISTPTFKFKKIYIIKFQIIN